MLAQKQPPLKECVIAHWSRGPARKYPGLKHRTEAAAGVYISTERPRRRKNWYLQGDGAMHSSAIQSDINTAESDFNKHFERCAGVYTTG